MGGACLMKEHKYCIKKDFIIINIENFKIISSPNKNNESNFNDVEQEIYFIDLPKPLSKEIASKN